MLAIYFSRCVDPLNFATRDLIYSCYASNSSNSCLQDEGYRAAEFIAADPLNDGNDPCDNTSGVVVTSCRQIHTSLTALDIVISGAAARAEMGLALQQFFVNPPSG